MNKGLQQVQEFHNLFNVPVLEEPTVIHPERFNLRINLIKEELNELEDAYIGKLSDKSEHHRKVEMLDALADLRYVLDGTILELGYKDVFDEAYKRVHESNMSKACKNVDEAYNTIQHYQDNKQVEAYAVQKDNNYIVYRKNDSKVLKSINYQPVELDDLV